MAYLGLDFCDALRDNIQDRLDRLWEQLVERGLSVILEDGTWQREERDQIRRIANRLGASTELHYFDVPLAELWRRLETRNTRPSYGAVPITPEILEDSRLRLQRPGQAEFSLFDRFVVHR